VVLCDSQYVVGPTTKWIFAWKKSGWKHAKGGPAQNKTEFWELDALIEQLEEEALDVEFW
ncbi:hypothetical protein DFH07DRAFT_709477, partial [Mycena maculata]